MSDYNYGLEPGIQGSGNSKMRFIVIFLLISAVTAAIVWWFLPEKDGPVSVKESPKAAVPELPVKENISQEKEKKENLPKETSQVAPKTEKQPVNPVPPLPEEKKNNKTSPSYDPTDPPLPDKGIITPADQKGADLPVVPVAEPETPEQLALLKKAASALEKKDFYSAEKDALQALVNVVEDSAFYRKAWRILTAARVGIVYGGTKGGYVVRYTIKSGDSLSGIAGRFFSTQEFLRKRNRISGSRIFVGRKLYIVPGDWKIVVSKKSRLLKLYRKTADKESLFAVWEIGIGRMGKTPSAEFAISSRVRHPDWYLPDGRIYKYGSPENQLGEYFLKLAPVTSPGRPLLGYGIHGTKDEESVGRSLSSGCVRMRNADVEVLYYLVPTGCRVEIKDN